MKFIAANYAHKSGQTHSSFANVRCFILKFWALTLLGILPTFAHAQSSVASSATPSEFAPPVLAAQHNLMRWTGKIGYPAAIRGQGQTDQAVQMQFSIYAVQSGGVALWSESQPVKVDADGRYSVLLGAASRDGLPTSLFPSGEARYIDARMVDDSGITKAANGEAEAPRSLLAAVPYAYKSTDAETLAGRAATDYVTLEDFKQGLEAALGATASTAVPQAAALTGAGTANTLAMWTTASNLGNSLITQSGTNVGIATTAAPATTLDVNGSATIRGSIILPANANATASAGGSSHSIGFTASSYSSSSATAIAQNYKWQAYPVGNDTSAPSSALELLFAAGTASPVATGLSIAPNGQITFAPGQTFPGSGGSGITGVTAGAGLTGGGTSGVVILKVDTTKVPQLATVNTFTGTQTIASGDLALPATTSAASGVLTIGGVPYLHGYTSGKNNVFVGGAGNFTTTGIDETAVGRNALLADTSGQQNTAAGTAALLANTTGSYNTAVGTGALGNNKTGNNNTAIGLNAGPDAASPALTNATAIGSGANVSQSNSLALGQNTVGSPGKTNVKVGIGTATPVSALEVSQLASEALGPVLTLSNTAGTAGTAASINFNTLSPSAGVYPPPSSQIVAANNGNNGDDISFISVNPGDFLSNGGSQTNMVVSANGGVGIGTSTPAPWGLEVVGQGYIEYVQQGTTAISGSGGSYIGNPGPQGSEPWPGGDGGIFTGGIGANSGGGDGALFYGAGAKNLYLARRMVETAFTQRLAWALLV